MKKQAIGEYVGIEKISENVTSGSGFEYSGSESKSMVIQRGKIVHIPDEFKSIIKEGDFAYYNKAREFSFKVDGETVTMIPYKSIVLIGSLD